MERDRKLPLGICPGLPRPERFLSNFRLDADLDLSLLLGLRNSDWENMFCLLLNGERDLLEMGSSVKSDFMMILVESVESAPELPTLIVSCIWIPWLLRFKSFSKSSISPVSPIDSASNANNCFTLGFVLSSFETICFLLLSIIFGLFGAFFIGEKL